ncbi:MAG: hypothetical protein JNL28_13900 [Planctomycetes bacterium]|nr:hypothetical protein [Planctomycetota bacterium]
MSTNPEQRQTPKTAKGTPSRTVRDGAVQLPELSAPVDLPAVIERSRLLQRLPQATLFALRLPHIEKLGAAVDRAGLRSLLSAPESQPSFATIQELWNRLARDVVGFEALKNTLNEVDGEVVYAVVAVDFAALSGQASASDAFPVTQALMLDAGQHADKVDVVLHQLLAALRVHEQADSGVVRVTEAAAATASGWRARVRTPFIEGDLMRDGSQFLLALLPPRAAEDVAHPLASHDIETSFLASDIVRGTKDLSRDGSAVVVEAFINLEPVWKTVEALSSPETRRMLTGSGAAEIRGLSTVASLSDKGIDEELFVMSPGGHDILTRAVTQRPLDQKIARYLPPEADYATMSSLDLSALFDGLTKALPDGDMRELQRTLADTKREGFDLRADLIDNIGPTFAFTGNLDVARMIRGDDAAGRGIDFTIIAEVRDGSRLRGIAEALIARAGARSTIQAKDIHGFMAYGMAPISLPTSAAHPLLQVEPHWYFGDDVFLFSFSRAGLARSLSASWKTDNTGPPELKEALAREALGAFSVGVSTDGANPERATTIGRRTSLGLELSARGGVGSTTVYTLASALGFAGGIAVPKLMAARLGANEQAAIETLRAMAAAESAFRDRVLLDQDADGLGEFGTLAELTGAADLRNGTAALTVPLLDASLKPDQHGLASSSGYLFKIELSNRLTRRIDFDEKEFCLHAWPIGFGATGQRAFALDAQGTLLATDNTGADQNYSGRERKPAPDAAKRLTNSKPRVGEANARSIDGGSWLELR